MDLVDKQDYVARGLDLPDQALDAAFKLAAELRAGHKTRQIQQINFAVAQALRHISLGDAQGDALGNGRLADARLADQAGIVFLAARQDLDGAVDLLLAADHAVHLAVARLPRQILAVIVEELALFPTVVLTFRLLALFLILPAPSAENTEWEGSAAARLEIAFLGLVVRLLIVGQGPAGHPPPYFVHIDVAAFHQAGKVLLHRFELLVGNAELFHQIVQRLDAHFSRAGQAVPLAFGLTRLIFLHKNDRRTLFASDTDHIVAVPSGLFLHRITHRSPRSIMDCRGHFRFQRKNGL